MLPYTFIVYSNSGVPNPELNTAFNENRAMAMLLQTSLAYDRDRTEPKQEEKPFSVARDENGSDTDGYH
jgi:hypothetical protein